MPLDGHHAQITDAYSEPPGRSVVGFSICWPNNSAYNQDLAITMLAGETLTQAATRLDLLWSPQWLTDAGFGVVDAGGADLQAGAAATTPGPVQWDLAARTCRVDDQIPDNKAPGHAARMRRVAGEVALLACWEQDRTILGMADERPAANISGNTRGARFRDFLVYSLQQALPQGWTVLPEVKLTTIRGLHMRRGVGGRSSDIVVLDPGNRLVAVVSSKWTWRSDRGTEAAQMVPLRQYRPDVPYTLVTSEFPRARSVAQESIEDRSYHLCPGWVGAWEATRRADNPRVEYPSLVDLRDEGSDIALNIGLRDLDDLISDLSEAGTIL
jgi:hypothetical protein